MKVPKKIDPVQRIVFNVDRELPLIEGAIMRLGIIDPMVTAHYVINEYFLELLSGKDDHSARLAVTTSIFTTLKGTSTPVDFEDCQLLLTLIPQRTWLYVQRWSHQIRFSNQWHLETVVHRMYCYTNTLNRFDSQRLEDYDYQNNPSLF